MFAATSLARKTHPRCRGRMALGAFIRDTLEDAGAGVSGLAGDCREVVNVLDGTGVEAVILDLLLQGVPALRWPTCSKCVVPLRVRDRLRPRGHNGLSCRNGAAKLTDRDLLAAVETLLDGLTVGQRLKALG